MRVTCSLDLDRLRTASPKGEIEGVDAGIQVCADEGLSIEQVITDGMDFVDVFHSIRRQQLLSKTQSSTAASFDALPEEELQDGDGVDDIHKFPAAEGGDQMPAASSFASNPQLRIADDEQMCLDDITRMLSNMLSHDVSEEQAREFVAEMKVDSKKLTFGEFRKAAASLLMGIRELESWVTSLELHKLVAKQVNSATCLRACCAVRY
eukprot:1576455-Rhodomonas_salina.3